MPKDDIKDKVDGKTLDLSLSNLTTVPVKEIASIPKATILDLSCNLLTQLPDQFCTLRHIVHLDLSKNQLTELPPEIGSLQKLQHFDLYQNSIEILPVGFCYLKNLKWLDLKDNPLNPKLKSVAGDCLDEFQCKKCAQNVIAFMKTVLAEQDRRLEKELSEKRAREAKLKEEEEKEKDRKKQEKKAEKDRRRKEFEAQKKQRLKKEKVEVSEDEEVQEVQKIKSKSKKSINGVSNGNRPQKKGGIGCCDILNGILVVLVAIAVGVFFFCDRHHENAQCIELKNFVQPYYNKVVEISQPYLMKVQEYAKGIQERYFK